MFSPQQPQNTTTGFPDWFGGNHGNKSLSNQMGGLNLGQEKSSLFSSQLNSAFSEYPNQSQQRSRFQPPPGLLGQGNTPHQNQQKLGQSPQFDPAIVSMSQRNFTNQPMAFQQNQNQEPHWMKSIANLTNDRSPSPTSKPMGGQQRFNGFSDAPMARQEIRTAKVPPGF